MSGTPVKILVIDDEEGIRLGCKRVLEPEGFVVEEARSFLAGQQKIAQQGYDLILLDVMMPDGWGMDLLSDIRKKDTDTVTIIITGYATVELAVEAIKNGAYDFISKPFDADMLTLKVEQGLENRHLLLEARRLQEVEQQAAELATAKAEMERLNTFKSRFMLVMAHELRAPIGAVQSLLRTLLKGLAGKLNEQQTNLLTRMDRRMDFMLTLIEDLFELAQSQEPIPPQQLHKVVLQPILNQVLLQINDQAIEKNISLHTALPQEELTVRASEDGMEKIFSNLIGNAVKYTPADGHVWVSGVLKNHFVQLTIQDTGIGIPQESVDQIWEEFYRAPNARKSGIMGTGLGLNIVHTFVEQFGGQIEVKSDKKKGTTFNLSFPAVHE